MTIRLAIPLALIVAAGCAEKITRPAVQSAPREPEVKTVAADNTPLFFVDGKEISADSVRRFPASSIESVEVIKGRTAIGLYGFRAQNGVVYVKTKR